MLWAGPLVLALATAATPAAPVASTYDDASCAELMQAQALGALGDSGELERAGGRAGGNVGDDDDALELAEIDCTPPPVAPAVIDCNDPHASLWVADMIGSCDMPRPQLAQPSALQRADRDGAPARVCDGLHCSHDSLPLRGAPRATPDSTVIALEHVAFHHVLTASPLGERAAARPLEAPRDRLERPPRSC